MEKSIRFLSFPFRIALLFVMIVTLPGCKSSHDKIMDKAEDIMQQHPDSARALLESIPSEKLSSDKSKARYTVLLTEARYKTFEDDTVAGPISKAADYYNGDLKSPYRMKAYYYKSNILYNTKKGGEALINLMHSEKTAFLRQDTLWLGLIHGEIGRNFANMNNPAASIPWLEMAVSELTGKRNNYYLSDYVLLLAKEYYNYALSSDNNCQDFSEKAIEQAKILKEIAIQENDHEYLYHVKKIIADCLILQDKLPEAKSILINMEDSLYMYMTPHDYVNLGELYLEDNNIVKAKACQDSVARLDPKRMSLMAAIARKEGNYEEAFNYLLRNQIYNQQDYKEWMQREQSDILYDNFRLTTRNFEITIKNQNLWIALLCCILVIICIAVAYQHNRSKKEKRKILNQAEDLRTVISTLEENNKESRNLAEAIEEVKEVLKSALSEQFNVLDDLTAKYYEVKDMSSRQSQFYRMIENLISSVQEDEKITENMAGIVDRHLDGLMSSLKTDLPNVTKNDYRIFLFTVLGFSAKSISVFEDVEIDKVYRRKYSLKKKLEKLPENIREKYLVFMA